MKLELLGLKDGSELGAEMGTDVELLMSGYAITLKFGLLLFTSSSGVSISIVTGPVRPPGRLLSVALSKSFFRAI